MITENKIVIRVGYNFRLVCSILFNYYYYILLYLVKITQITVLKIGIVYI